MYVLSTSKYSACTAVTYRYAHSIPRRIVNKFIHVYYDYCDVNSYSYLYLYPWYYYFLSMTVLFVLNILKKKNLFTLSLPN